MLKASMKGDQAFSPISPRAWNNWKQVKKKIGIYVANTVFVTDLKVTDLVRKKVGCIY